MEAVVTWNDWHARPEGVEADGTRRVGVVTSFPLQARGPGQAHDGLQKIVSEARVVESKDGKQGDNMLHRQRSAGNGLRTISASEQRAELRR